MMKYEIKEDLNILGLIHKDVRAYLPVFNPLPPLFMPLRFLLSNPLSLSVQTMSWKTKSCNKHGQAKPFERKYILYLFRVYLFVFQYLAPVDDDRRTFKCPLLSYKDHTERVVHLQLSPLPPLPLLSALFLAPSIPLVPDILYGCPL